ncbi:cephalosporin-C deacetylase-like acetyl esterase [Allocatelliglobosispora scoriae]|uniref:Cephalosporin-C deacetylase-like acetyl esterase n=1 Tax=Allocatelliglobosispora scoriae TaxID=643052 RepID=A0A841BIL9_9ACTN|nr:acetylxylan esterase [Allocatelliglobosispora scoriae]MBB5868967.1 cephalosporin-C deacetylase-like acetyl esterase [Allocatelliglobosispora scoriae]
MPLTDLRLPELDAYRPTRRIPADFDEFWASTLAQARTFPLDPVFTPVASGLAIVDVFDVAFSGFGGDRIRAWLALPRGVALARGVSERSEGAPQGAPGDAVLARGVSERSEGAPQGAPGDAVLARGVSERSEGAPQGAPGNTVGRLPCVVEFPGYGGGRGLPTDCLLYAAAGYAHLFVDIRGQGSGWRSGDTPDPHGTGPQHPGVMTRGVLDPAGYYYRRVITDCVRAVEVAAAHPAVDPDRIAVTGISQGGGLTLAVAGLSSQVAAAAPDVPFLCDMRRGTEIASAGPFQEVVGYLAVHRGHEEQVFETLAYADGVNFAERAECPSLFSVALMDESCPASTVFGAYHLYAGPKAIEVYPFNGHEGGESVQDAARLAFLARHLS